MDELVKKLRHFKTLCFVDLEGTQYTQEIIAIGAVKASIHKDGTIKRINKGFYSLVKSKNKVGPFVINLTGIKDDDLKKDGISFRVAMEKLKKYVGKDFDKCLYVAYGNQDFRMFAQSLAYNLDANKDLVHNVISKGFDFSEFLSRFVKDENGCTLSLSNALKTFNVDFKGTQHNALDDAYNLSFLYDAFLKNPDIIKKQYLQILINSTHLPQPLSKLLKKLYKSKKVELKDLENYVEEYIK